MANDRESPEDAPIDARRDDGERLAAQTRRLALLVRHLAGPAIRRRVDVDDLVQEVFLRALTAPGGLPAPSDGELHLARFLNRIARHTVVDVARAARARKRGSEPLRLAREDWSRTSGIEPPARTAGPLSRAALRETEARLADAWEALSPDYRRVIGLRQFEGLSAAEAGTRLGRSATAVHSLYRRALEAWEAAAGEAE